MTKFLAAIVVAAVAVGVVQAMPAAHGEEACTGAFPYWSTGATSETQNNERISCVRQKRSDIKDRERTLDARIEHLRQKLERARAKRHVAREAETDNNRLLAALQNVRGSVMWLYSTRTCESHSNYEAHSDSGTYHGAYQDSISSWAGRYGYDDPHDAPWYLQDSGNADIERARGTGPWPNCG